MHTESKKKKKRKEKKKDRFCILKLISSSIEELKKEIEILQREKINKLTALENRKRNLKQAVDSLKDLQRSVEEERAAIVKNYVVYVQ